MISCCAQSVPLETVEHVELMRLQEEGVREGHIESFADYKILSHLGRTLSGLGRLLFGWQIAILSFYYTDSK